MTSGATTLTIIINIIVIIILFIFIRIIPIIITMLRIIVYIKLKTSICGPSVVVLSQEKGVPARGLPLEHGMSEIELWLVCGAMFL
jgi:hypothetical protein